MLEAALTATAGTTSSMELTPLMSAAVFALNVESTSDGEWRETAKAKGARSARAAWCRPRPPRGDPQGLAEAESPPRSSSLAAVMRPGVEFGYFDAKRNLLSLMDPPWPGRHVCTAGPGF